jgi:plastocyanin
MAINFPATSGQPTDGSYTHTVGNITWLWDGLTWRSGVSSSTNESDPIFTSSTAGSITSINIANWNTAYSWGDHSQAGYLTSLGNGGGASVTASDTAPTSPSDGDLWWQSDTGYLKIYYNDGDSTQWVDASPAGTGSGGGGGGISLASLSVTSNSVGTAALTYNNSNGVFSYTPPDLSAYLTSLGDAAGVTTAKITSWDTAYGWGDHANSGYLTSYTEVDTLDTVTGRGSSTNNNLIFGGSTDFNDQIQVADDVVLNFGASQDGRISYTSSTDTFYIRAPGGSANLILGSGPAVRITSQDGLTDRAVFSSSGVTITGSLTAGGLTYPTTNGTSEQVLSSDGAGNVQWVDQSSGSTGQIYSIAVTAPSTSEYNLNGNDRLGSVSGDDAPITINEGDTIQFVISSGTNHPFYIRDTSGGTSVSNPTVSNQGATSGQVSWTPQISNGGSVGSYVYQCGNHSGMVGTITVRARNTANEIDTLDSVTGRGATTTNTLSVGSISDSIGPLRRLGVEVKSGAYTLVTGDAGKMIVQSAASQSITVPTGFTAGDMVTIVNQTTSDINIIEGSGLTLYNTADGTNGTRILAQRGACTFVFTAANTAYISGSGLS